MKRILIGLIMAVLIVGLGNFGNSEDKPSKDYNELIKQLGNDDFQTRENAEKRLTEYGSKLIEQYRIAKSDKKQETSDNIKKDIEKVAQIIQNACQGKEPEIKNRANQIRQYFYRLIQPKIAFVQFKPDLRDQKIYLINADGSNQTRLTDNSITDTEWNPAWSPDGKRIAFIAMNEIYVIDADGKNKIKLTEYKVNSNTSNDPRNPVWSPDGKKIAFGCEVFTKMVLHSSSQQYQICVIDADGKNRRKLTGDKSSEDTRPAWNPDGTKLFFTSFQDSGSYLYVMDADGKNKIKLTKMSDNGSPPFLDSDCKKNIFVLYEHDCRQIYIMDTDGKNKTQLAEYNDKSEIGAISWNPDGTKIAVTLRMKDGKKQIYIMDTDGKNKTQLAEYNDKSEIGAISWSPDETKIAFELMMQGNKKQIYVMDTNGKNQQRLTENQFDNSNPVWNPLSFTELSALFAEEKK